MEYLSQKEYEEIAEKILHASYPHLYKDIIKDIDKFGSIVNAIMMADWKFNGIGNIFGYRKQRVSWAIKKMYSKPIKEMPLSLDKNDNDILLLIPTKEEYPEIEYEDMKNYICDKVIKSNILTTKEKQYISYYLIDKMSLEDIAAKVNINKRAVVVRIRDGIKKLGIYNGYLERFADRQRRGKSS